MFVCLLVTNVKANTSDGTTISFIDYPKQNEIVKNELKIQGWVMSKEANTTVEAYLNDTLVPDVERKVRNDVINAITGYGTIEENPMPGYYKEVDISNLPYGDNKLTIKVLKNDTVILTDKVTFKHEKPKTWVYLDYPVVNGSYASEAKLKVQGWVMSESANSTVEMEIDGKKIEEELERKERSDVIKAIKGYGTINENPTPGYYKEIDISKLTYGNHIVKIIAKNQSGNILSELTRTINVRKPKTWVYLDYPITQNEYVNELKVQGWVMSESANSRVEMEIDGKKIEEELERKERSDVIKAIKGYGTINENPTPGFAKTFNITKYSYGKHNLKIKAYDKENRLIGEIARTFNRSKPRGIAYVENLSNTVYGESIYVSGWYLANVRDANIELYLDENRIESFNQIERPDVYKVYKDTYGRYTEKPGFSVNYDASLINDGKHTFEVIVKTGNYEIAKKSVTFNLYKVRSTMYIEYTEQSKQREGYFVSGWEMSTSSDSYLKVFIDNKKQSIDINRIARQDVINAIKGYGGIEVNPTPGFVGYIDTTNISIGKHTVELAIYSRFDEKIASTKRTINIYTKDYAQINDNKHVLYNPPYYNQKDSRWTNKKYGLSTFGNTGCAPTSMAMAFSTILGREILPTEIGDYLYCSTNEFNKKAKGSSGMAIIYATNQYHIKREPINNVESLNSALADGKIIFAAMGNGRYATAFWNHAIIMKGYNNGTTYTIDPLNTYNNIWIDTQTVWNQRSSDRDDCTGGAYFYALESYK